MTTSLDQIQQLYRRYRTYTLAVLLLLIVSLAALFINRIFAFPLVAIALICHLFLLRPCQKQYVSMVTKTNLAETICKAYRTEDAVEKGGSLMTEDILAKAALMPCGDGKNVPLLRWELSGKKDGIRFTLCDATIPQDFKLAERGRRRVHFNSGVWAHMELPADTQMRFKILDETSVPTPIRMDYFSQKWDYETASIPDSELADRFVLYRPKNMDQQLPARFLRSLKSLMNYTPGYVAVSVSGSHMDIFIRGRFLSRPVSLSQKPTRELLNFDPFPELGYLIDLAKSVLQ